RIAALFTEHDQAYRAVLRVPGIGPVFAAVFRAEIGEVTRFPSPRQLNSWAGLTPRHRESDTIVHREPITKQGSRLVRWAAVEAVQRSRAGTPMRRTYEQILTLRGARAKHLAKVAAARELLSCVFYALRDGHVRRLASTAT
ncbi:MAG TPA: IS110 family transposase, partial [Kribbella sp.]